MATIACCWSCSGGEDDVPAPTPTPKPETNKIEISTSASVVEQKGGTASVSFTTNAAWTASIGTSTSWLKVSPTSGTAGTHTLTITTEENDTYDERNATLTIKAGNASQNLTITQKQKDGLTVTSNKIEVGADGGNFSIEAKSNVNVTFEIEESAKDWITASESRGLTAKTLKFTAKANEEKENRQGNIILKGGDGLNETITVYQDGNSPTLVITSDDIIVGSDGKTIKIELKSNVNYTMALPQVNWISKEESRAISAYTHYLAIAPNETYDQRSAVVYFQSEAEGLKDSINITQLQKDAIIVAKNEYEVAPKGEKLEFTISTNVDFEVSTSVEWIKQNTDSRGLVGKELSFTIDENEGMESREGEIYITFENLKQTIKIIQLGYEAIERTALIEFYKATNGDNWKNNTNWCSDKPISEWYGVYTNKLGYVISLDLAKNNLVGYLPKEIGALGKLETFSVALNRLSGIIPDELWTISTLKEIDLSVNYFTGELTSSIGNAKELHKLWLCNNCMYGELPNELWCLTKLENLNLGNSYKNPNWNYESNQLNKFSGSISPDISQLSNLRVFYMTCLQLTGKIPDELWDIQTLEEVDLKGNYLTGELSPAIKNAHSLKVLDLRNNSLSGKIPEEICELTTLLSFNIANFDKLKISNGIEIKFDRETQFNSISGDIPENISALTNLSYISLANNNITGEFPECFAYNPNLYYNAPVLYGNRMSGVISSKITNSENWQRWSAALKYLLPQQNGYGFILEAYESTDYSEDGKIKLLQTATKGNGIDIILMGDAYSDRLIADGTYDRVMNTAMETFFTEEPYKSFRDHFNVYCVKAVSKNEVYTGTSSTVFEGNFSNRIGANNSRILSYAKKAISEERMDNALIVVMFNTKAYDGACVLFDPTNEDYGDWGNGTSISYMTVSDNYSDFTDLLLHEAAGHGFAKLADEYVQKGYGAIPESSIEYIKGVKSAYGWYKNIDLTNDPNEVGWSHFLSDERYAYDGLGIYEGALYYSSGVWRATKESIMHYHTGGFNAPSREAIYYRIHKLAYGEDWKYDYEEFVKYDAINRNTVSRSAIKPFTESEKREYAKNHRPPTIIKGTWRDAMKGKNQIVVPLR